VQLNSSAGWQYIGDEIHVWHASLDRDDPAICEWEAVLSAEEIARADQFHFTKDRKRYVIARGLLRELLGAYLQQTPKSLEFSYAQHRKPFLSGVNSASGLSFNLSHSGEMVAYAIARERNLGIDVERIRPDLAGDDIAERYFSAREVNDLKTLPPEKRVEGFFNCWTRKEAYLKATGMGLHIALDSFAVNLLSAQPAEFLGGVEPKWHLAAHRPAEGYAAAVVYDGAPCAIRYFSADNMARQQTKIG
jgi:4'-phosphopantetheinyl transferase